MIINNTFNFVFVHIPKSAGTTLTSVLSAYSSYCDIEVGGTQLGEAVQPFFQARFGLSKHSTIREIKSVVGDVLLKRYLSFAFVRNPYSRAYSAYKFLSRVRKEKQMASLAVFDKFKTFPDFIISDYFQGEGLDRILMPQLFWIRRDNRNEDIAVDYVGRIETFSSCLDELFTLIGGGMERRKIAGPLPNLNRSSEGEQVVWKEFANNPNLIDVIRKRYEVDFRVFGYASDPSDVDKYTNTSLSCVPATATVS